MRIVVTGATSFIGLAVIEDLLHGGRSWKEGRESVS